MRNARCWVSIVEEINTIKNRSKEDIIVREEIGLNQHVQYRNVYGIYDFRYIVILLVHSEHIEDEFHVFI